VRRAFSLRVTLLAVALAAGAYAAALPVYLFFRVSRPALALGAATEAITTVSAAFARRDSALNRRSPSCGTSRTVRGPALIR